MAEPNPTVVEVARFEDLPPGLLASRRAMAPWSDGTIGECLFAGTAKRHYPQSTGRAALKRVEAQGIRGVSMFMTSTARRA